MDVEYRVGAPPTAPPRTRRDNWRRGTDLALDIGWTVLLLLLLVFLSNTVHVPSITGPDTPRWTYVSEAS